MVKSALLGVVQRSRYYPCPPPLGGPGQWSRHWSGLHIAELIPRILANQQTFGWGEGEGLSRYNVSDNSLQVQANGSLSFGVFKVISLRIEFLHPPICIN